MRRTPIVLIVGHGSRDASANEEFEQLVERYQARRPDLELHYGYVELARPSLNDALAAIPADSQEVTLLPLFLFAAGHVKNDVPLALATARRLKPKVNFQATSALGIDPALVELALARADEVVPLTTEAPRTTVIVVGRGSSDPDANADFSKVTRLIAEARPFSSVVPTFIGITQPRFKETLELAARARPERLLVIPYLLFAGRLLTQLREQVAEFRGHYPWIKTEIAPQLGLHERLFDVLDERLLEIPHSQTAST